MGDLRRIQAGVFSDKDKIIKTSEMEKFFREFKKANFIKKYFFYKKILSFSHDLEELFNRLDKIEKIKKIHIKKEALKYLKSGAPMRVKNILDSDKNKIFYNQKYSIFYKKNFLAVGVGISDNLKNEEEEIIKIKKLF
jgi:tRNA U55 pseudouridine synthase TruB